MTTHRWQLVITTTDPTRSARFWRHALGYIPQPPPHGYPDWDAYADAQSIALRHGTDIDAAIDPAGRTPRLLFVRDDPAVRGNLSIEILTGTAAPASGRDVRSIADDLVASGADLVSATDDAGHRWAQLRSPDGHAFRIM